MPGPWEKYGSTSSQQQFRVTPLPQSAESVRQEGRADASAGRDATRTDIAIGADARDAGRDRRAADKQGFDLARDMRTEFNKLPAVTDYQTVIRQYSSALKTQPNASGDQALITAYAKMLDPGSVVREQEFNTVANADSSVGKIEARLRKELGLDASGMIRPEIRARVRDEMLNLTQSYRRAYEQARGDYTNHAQGYDIDPVRVVGTDFGDPYRADIQKALEQQKRSGGGGTPWQQDTVAAPGGFAAPGDDRKSIPIPPDMQSEYTAYVTKNRGRLDPDAYAQFRSDQERRYGFEAASPDQLKAYRQEAERMNSDARAGRNLNLGIPAPDAAMSVRDRVNNAVFDNSAGAALMDGLPLSGGMDEAAGAVRSLALGTDYNVERDRADAIRQQMRGRYPGASAAGSVVGPIAMGGIAGSAALRYAPRLATTGGQFAAGTALGGASGALENNDNRLMGGAVGAGAGAGGVAFGRYVLGPAADALMRSRAADKVVNAGVRGVNAITGRNAALRNAPRLATEERAVASAIPELSQIRTNLADAQDRGLPYALGDASPKLRALTGAVTRRSPDAREMAENTIGQRWLDQADRLKTAVDTELAPITNMGERRQQWLSAAQDASQPLYDQARRIGFEMTPEIESVLTTPTGKQALGRAVNIGLDEGKDPFEIGFVEDGAGGFTLPGLERYQRGRYSNVPAGDPREGIPTQTFRGWNGKTFQHQGPVDLATFVRQNGGLLDQNTELSHMGLTNKSRGLPFAGNDSKFGPLINPKNGLTYDEMAERAWEAGYFGPDRPSVNQFLDDLRGTQEGWGRKFLPQDEAVVARFSDALDHAGGVRKIRGETGSAPVFDNSTSAGPRDFAPLDAWNPNVHDAPTFETLDLWKRGLDSILDEERSNVTGRLELENNPRLQAIEGLLQRGVSALDRVNGIYPKARGEYEKYISNRDWLDRGHDAGQPSIPSRDVNHALSLQNDSQLGEYQRGYATRMSDVADNARMSGNPWEAAYGTTNQQDKVGMIFPGAPRFKRTYDLERDMAKTTRETLGGSPTAGRLAADQQLMGNDGMGEDLANAGLQAATGGGVPGMATAARRFVGDRMSLGFGKAAEERANRLAPRLMDTNGQEDILAYLDDIAMRNAEIQRRRQAAQNVGGLLGGMVGSSVAPRF